MRLIFLPAFFAVSISILASCSRQTTPTDTYDEPVRTAPIAASSRGTNMEESILHYVNNYRRTKGLSALQMIDVASQQAYNHSRNMATGRTAFGHDGFSQRVTNMSSQLGRIPAAAENVAFGSLSAREVVDLWISSPGHRKNMEGNYNQTGIGVYADRGGALYFTQLFLRR